MPAPAKARVATLSSFRLLQKRPAEEGPGPSHATKKARYTPKANTDTDCSTTTECSSIGNPQGWDLPPVLREDAKALLKVVARKKVDTSRKSLQDCAEQVKGRICVYVKYLWLQKTNPALLEELYESVGTAPASVGGTDNFLKVWTDDFTDSEGRPLEGEESEVRRMCLCHLEAIEQDWLKRLKGKLDAGQIDKFRSSVRKWCSYMKEGQQGKSFDRDFATYIVDTRLIISGMLR